MGASCRTRHRNTTCASHLHQALMHSESIKRLTKDCKRIMLISSSAILISLRRVFVFVLKERQDFYVILKRIRNVPLISKNQTLQKDAKIDLTLTTTCTLYLV